MQSHAAVFDLMVETYGELNADKSNAILICHALSGSHHAAGYHSSDDKKSRLVGYFIGPGKAIDTTRFLWCVLTTLVAATARPVQPVPTQKPASPMVQIFP